MDKVARFTIRYVSSDGEKYQVVKDDHYTEIDLSDTSIRTISLEPLGQCGKLEKLNLDTNLLTDIDLTPLTFCSSLKILSMTSNELTHIDLGPLSRCSNLQALELSPCRPW